MSILLRATSDSQIAAGFLLLESDHPFQASAYLEWLGQTLLLDAASRELQSQMQRYGATFPTIGLAALEFADSWRYHLRLAVACHLTEAIDDWCQRVMPWDLK